MTDTSTEAVTAPPALTFDAPYEAYIRTGHFGEYVALHRAGELVATFSFREWGGEPTAIQAAWNFAYRVETCAECDALSAERDRLAAQVVQLQRDMDAANARADEVLNPLQSWQSIAHNCTITSGVCCCGDNMDGHSEPVVCGHVPRDHGEYMSSLELVRTSAILDKTGETL